jgi:hypothetical protein
MTNGMHCPAAEYSVLVGWLACVSAFGFASEYLVLVVA